MIVVLKKISVLVITYNQEDVIRRTIDSILQQKSWGLHHIVVNDDCSKDNTWAILNEYKERYPEIMRIYQNPTNLGIYANSEELYKRKGDSDFYEFLAGDDALCEGLFENVQKTIQSNNISPNTLSAIVFDWKYISPEGKEKVFSQVAAKHDCDTFGLCIRHLVYQRGMIMTKAVIDKYEKTILDKGLNLAEYLYDTQGIRNTKKMYYLPFVGSIYYTGIGIAKTLIDSTYYKEEELIKWEYFFNNLARNRKDKNYINSCIYRTKFIMTPSAKYALLTIVYYILGFRYYNSDSLRLKRFFGPMIKILFQ